MTERALGPFAGKTILVVEDEYAIAELIQGVLERHGAIVLGPAPTISAALPLISRSPDAAILDVNLQGSSILPVAVALDEARVPFLFSTGYGQAGIPTRYAHVSRLRKPFVVAELVAALRTMIDGTPR